jgi:hypothetical protein
MAFIVEMINGRGDEPGVSHFDCSSCKGGQLLDLGKKFGWKPKGTVFGDFHSKLEISSPREDYRLSEWLYSKKFLTEDRLALADALQRFIDSSERDSADLKQREPKFVSESMTSLEDGKRFNGDLSISFLEDFIKFLQTKDFIFAYDD